MNTITLLKYYIAVRESYVKKKIASAEGFIGGNRGINRETSYSNQYFTDTLTLPFQIVAAAIFAL
jgi:hypothetical protein